jgi:hypothetical protein
MNQSFGTQKGNSHYPSPFVITSSKLQHIRIENQDSKQLSNWAKLRSHILDIHPEKHFITTDIHNKDTPDA